MGGPRCWPAAKERLEAVDGVPDIDRLVIIAIKRNQARHRLPLEQVVEATDHIGDVEGTIRVGISPQELWRRRGEGEDATTQLDGHTRLRASQTPGAGHAGQITDTARDIGLSDGDIESHVKCAVVKQVQLLAALQTGRGPGDLAVWDGVSIHVIDDGTALNDQAGSIGVVGNRATVNEATALCECGIVHRDL